METESNEIEITGRRISGGVKITDVKPNFVPNKNKLD